MPTSAKLLFILFSLLPFALIGQIKDSISMVSAEFTENKGQWPEPVRFKAFLGNGNLWIENNSFLFDLSNAEELESLSHHKHQQQKKLTAPSKIKRHSYRMRFANANPNPSILCENPLSIYENYFLGNDPQFWASGVKKYSKLSIQNLYNGIDLRIYEQSQRLKWDFEVAAQSDPAQIQIRYEGVDKLQIKNNNLIISTSVNQIIELAPYAYQIIANEKVKVECYFVLVNNQVNFIFPKSYNPQYPLIIDPTLVFASYTGSYADNWGFSATYDSKGFLYAGGIAFGTGYPTTLGAYDLSYNNSFDVSISKFDTTGSNLIYSTYLGGANGEVPASLIVNSKDELVVLGTTSSGNFPTLASSYDDSYNGGQNTNISSSINFQNGSDLFITLFSANGSQLIGSTYLGGSKNDGINSSVSLVNNYGDDIRGEVITDKNDNIYLVSTTSSLNFPTTANAFQPSKNLLNDGVIAKFDNCLSNLIWASYFGGNKHDAIYGLKLSKKGDIYITGGTMSIDLPIQAGAYKTTFQGDSADGFVAKIAKNGQSILKCSYIGSAAYDQSYLIDLDRYDHVYLFGQTLDTSNVFIYNALWNSPLDGQFLIKLNPNLNNLVWSTTFGNGSHGTDLVPSAFMVDLCNRIYLSAWGGAVNSSFSGGNTYALPYTLNGFQTTTDGSDYYLMVMADDASALDYGSFYGGSSSDEHVDGGTSRFDNKGRIYQNVCAGCGGHDDFPTTTGCYSSINNSSNNNCNNGVFKIDFNIPAIVADYQIPPVVCLPDTTFFINKSFLSHPTLTQYYWNFGDGGTSTAKNPYHIYNQSGVYDVKLIIYDPQSCNLRDTISQQVVVLSGQVDTLASHSICLGQSTQIGILPVNDPSVLFHWTSGGNLSNYNLSNPYANPANSTWYTLAMSNSVCTDTLYQLVKVIDLQVFAGNDTSICQQTIILQGSGNQPNLSYHWSSNNLFTDTLNNFPTDSLLLHVFSQPSYLYLKCSVSGCESYDSLFVDNRIVISSANVVDVNCHGDQNGSIQINPMGGVSPYQYQWSNGQPGAVASNLGAGNYQVTVSDQDGCFSIFDTSIYEPALLLSQAVAKNIPCETACIGKAWANAQGGTPPYHWQWDDPSTQTNNPATQLCQGVYHVTLTDQNQCITLDTVSIIDSSLLMVFDAWADFDTIYEGQQIGLHATNFGTNYTYQWTPSTALSDASIYNPLADPTKSTTYTVEVNDAYGCHWSDVISIYVIDVICEEPYIYVPNAFTPDGDGKNDLIYVNSSVGYELQWMIFDRWGELVFETSDINQAWDGTYKGEKLNAGVYVYHLKLTCYSKEVFIKKGNITLIR